MFISWNPPYTLPGLTVQYIISVGTEQHVLNSTNYTYCPLNLTSNKGYLFNITASNKVGNGSTSNVTVGFQSSMYNTCCINTYYTFLIDSYFLVIYQKNVTYRINNNWSLHFLLSVSIISSTKMLPICL